MSHLVSDVHFLIPKVLSPVQTQSTPSPAEFSAPISGVPLSPVNVSPYSPSFAAFALCFPLSSKGLTLCVIRVEISDQDSVTVGKEVLEIANIQIDLKLSPFLSAFLMPFFLPANHFSPSKTISKQSSFISLLSLGQTCFINAWKGGVPLVTFSSFLSLIGSAWMCFVSV